MILNTSAILSSRSFSLSSALCSPPSFIQFFPIVFFISFSPLFVFFSVVSFGGISFGEAEKTCWLGLLWQLHGKIEKNTNGKSRIERKCNVSEFEWASVHSIQAVLRVAQSNPFLVWSLSMLNERHELMKLLLLIKIPTYMLQLTRFDNNDGTSSAERSITSFASCNFDFKKLLSGLAKYSKINL